MSILFFLYKKKINLTTAKFLRIVPQRKELDGYEKAGKEEKSDDRAACCTENERAPEQHRVDLLCTEPGL